LDFLRKGPINECSYPRCIGCNGFGQIDTAQFVSAEPLVV
jgi:hypothetical protein